MQIDDIVDKMSEIVKRLKSSRLLASLRNTDLFRRESSAMNGVEAIVWWEARRIPYNLIVGSTGIVTCVVVGVIAVAAQEFFNSDFGVPDPPLFALFGVILYGILANVCFTAGWIVELFLRRFSPREADRFAISGLFYGVIFSVLLTLAPAVLVGAVGTFHLLHYLTAR
jgi:hypothetical protein